MPKLYGFRIEIDDFSAIFSCKLPQSSPINATNLKAFGTYSDALSHLANPSHHAVKLLNRRYGAKFIRQGK